MAEGPPMYRPEEYIFHLRKWFADSDIQTTDNRERDKKAGKDGHEVNNVSIVLTELLDISELLRNLKFDLKLAHAGFVAEFIREPNNGISLLLDYLKATQLSGGPSEKREENNNNNNNNNNNSHHNSNQSACGGGGGNGGNGGGGMIKNRPQQVKKMLADEYECLLSLKHATRYSETMKHIMDHPSGVFVAASCAHSNFMKSRVVALELLIKACEFGPDGHNHVQKAMSTLRLRFGEPVRFKFLIGMLSSPGNKSLTFQAYCLSFLNKLLETSQNICKRVYLQCEIDEAGLDMKLLQKFMDYRDFADHKAYAEAFRAWKRNYVDVEGLVMVSRRLTADNKQLRTEVEKLRESTKKLEEDKMSLINVERQLSEQCAELEQKVTTLSQKTETSQGESVSDRMVDSKQSLSTEDTHENMGTPKTSSEESDANSGSPSPQPHVISINKGSDAMSISSEDSHKLSTAGKTRNGTLDLQHEENEIIIPHIKQRSPLYVWPNRNTTAADTFMKHGTASMSDEVFIRHHLMQDVAGDKAGAGVSLRVRLLKNDNQKQSDEVDDGEPISVTNRHLRHDDFSLNWSYPAVPLPIAVVTSGKSSLQDMTTSSSSSTSNNHVLASNQVLTNDRFVNQYRIPPLRNGPMSENTNYQTERLSLDFHKTLFQRSYPVPSSERLTRTFHV